MFAIGCIIPRKRNSTFQKYSNIIKIAYIKSLENVFVIWFFLVIVLEINTLIDTRNVKTKKCLHKLKLFTSLHKPYDFTMHITARTELEAFRPINTHYTNKKSWNTYLCCKKKFKKKIYVSSNTEHIQEMNFCEWYLTNH